MKSIILSSDAFSAQKREREREWSWPCDRYIPGRIASRKVLADNRLGTRLE